MTASSLAESRAKNGGMDKNGASGKGQVQVFGLHVVRLQYGCGRKLDQTPSLCRHWLLLRFLLAEGPLFLHSTDVG